MTVGTHEILAVREDHRGMRYFTECWHKDCYPDTEMSIQRGEDKEQHIIHDAQIGTMGGSKMSILVKHTHPEYGVDFQDMDWFIWQVCDVCKKPILPYRYTVTYSLDGVSKVGPGYTPVTIKDVTYRFNNLHFLSLAATPEDMHANYGTNTVIIHFHTYDVLTVPQINSLNINGVIPQIDLERIGHNDKM